MPAGPDRPVGTLYMGNPMDRYGPVSTSEKRAVRRMQIAKLPLYLVGLIYPLVFVLWRGGFEQFLAGPNAYLMFSTCVIASIFLGKTDLMVANFILRKWLPRGGAFLIGMTILPMLIIAGFAAHYGMANRPDLPRLLASLLALPYFVLMLVACLSGLRHPFWPAAMRQELARATEAAT